MGKVPTVSERMRTHAHTAMSARLLSCVMTGWRVLSATALVVRT
jgi:hypothetical protein